MTKTKKIKATDEIQDPSLLQWIPANYSTKDNKFISPINNCDQNENKKLYKSIEQIFSKFIPQFQKVFDGLHENERIDDEIDLSEYEIYRSSLK